MADAAQLAIQLVIVWFLNKRRAKRVRIIEEKRSSFLYIYNRQPRLYFGQLLLACINQPRLRTNWTNPREATWFEMVTDRLLLLRMFVLLQLSKDNCILSSDHRSIKAGVTSTDQVFPRFLFSWHRCVRSFRRRHFV